MTTRTTPRALNKVQLVFGIEPRFFAVAFMSAGVAMMLHPLLAFPVVIGVLVLGKSLTVKDTEYPSILIANLAQKASYEPQRRKVFRLEIK